MKDWTAHARTEALAKQFAITLRDWLSAGEMLRLVDMNAAETDPKICHSHEFCDANLAMNRAAIALDIDLWEKDGTMSTATIDMWNSAWELAKTNNFWISPEDRDRK